MKKHSGGKENQRRGMRVTARDIELLFALFTARYLTTEQLQALFFRASKGGRWGRIKACQQRLKLLYEHKFVRRIQLPVKRGDGPSPYIYALDRQGAELLMSERGIELAPSDWQPRAQEENYPFLEHLLATTDVRISLLHACEQNAIMLEEWVDEKELKSAHMVDHVTITGPHGGELSTAVVPDGYFKICRAEKRAIFFLEIDLRNVTVAPSMWERRGWTRKIRAYLEYFKSEAYQTKYEGRRARILTITSGKTRLENLKKATESVFEEMGNAGEGTCDMNRFWFTTFESALDPAQLLTGPIWRVAGSSTSQMLHK